MTASLSGGQVIYRYDSKNKPFRITASVVIFPKNRQQLFSDPNGPVGVFVKGSAQAILETARGLIGTRYSGQHLKRGKRLKDSGVVIPTFSGQSVSYTVEFQHEAAYLHHEGTRAHSIGKAGRNLYNPNDPARTMGGIFEARGPVTHRGSKANRYLVNAARQHGLTIQSPGALRRGETSITARLQGFA